MEIGSPETMKREKKSHLLDESCSPPRPQRQKLTTSWFSLCEDNDFLGKIQTHRVPSLPNSHRHFIFLTYYTDWSNLNTCSFSVISDRMVSKWLACTVCPRIFTLRQGK